MNFTFFFFQAEDGIRDLVRSRGLGDVYKRQAQDRDLYELPPEEKKLIKQVPSSLVEVLDALEADHEFLLKGGVFTPDPVSYTHLTLPTSDLV